LRFSLATLHGRALVAAMSFKCEGPPHNQSSAVDPLNPSNRLLLISCFVFELFV
jgi:hypothetical protein